MEQTTAAKPFYFKQFNIHQDKCAMKVGTDGVLLGAWATVDDASAILDIGTGTGVIAIMLAQRSPTATIHAVEIDQDAFDQALGNMQASPWAERLHCFHTSIQDFAKQPGHRTYDLIVSNPPFFSGGTFSNSQDKASVRHTVKLPHGDLLSVVRSLLAPEGRFCLILPHIEGLRFKEMANSYGLYCTNMLEVLPKADKPVERLLLQFERKVRPLEKSSLVIHDSSDMNTWSDGFRELTSGFYTKF